MIYPRKLTKQLTRELSSPEIIVITGMRRTGKTTILHQLFNMIKSDNKVLLDLENPLNQKIFEEKHYDNILENLKEFDINPNRKLFIFLDEIQIMPEITKAIKYLYDHYRIKFFLTGSSSFYLKNLFSESLSGRKFVFQLYPLDFEEFLVFKEKKKVFHSSLKQKALQKNKIAFEKYKKYYEEYLRFGGFPGVVVEKDRRRKEKRLEDIFISYFEQDVKVLTDFRSISKLRDLILLLSKRVGSKLEITKIASELSLSRETVYSYLSFLESTYFLFLVKPFSRSIDRQVSGASKIYFCDTGLLRWLGNSDEGALFENSVFHNIQIENTVHYYQSRTGGEIDFILNKHTALEVKIHARDVDVRRLERLKKALKLKQIYLITKNYFDHKKAILAIDV